MSPKMVVVSIFLLFLIFSFSLATSAPSRVLTESSQTTAIFDVSAATKQAQKALSFHPQNFKHGVQSHQKINIPSKYSFSLPLHPRMALQKSPYNDYQSLVKSRLTRDAARVQFLNHKLQLALNGGSALRPVDLSAPVTSGQSRGNGDYFVRIDIGLPVKSFFFFLDTGSDINWLQCQPSKHCFKQSDPIFDLRSSSSYSPLSCNSQQCQILDQPKCHNGKCLYQITYGDGSFSTGEFATETLTFANSESISNIAIGCGHDNEGPLFIGSVGIIGLGGAPPSLPSQIKASSFSYCLVDLNSNSSSTLDFNSVQLGDSVITSTLLKNENITTFRYVEVTGLSVGGEQLLIPPSSFQINASGFGGVIIDSGTTITRFRTEIYEVLRDAFKNRTRNLPPAQVRVPIFETVFDTCYDLSYRSKVEVPIVAIQLTGGKSLRLPANNVIIPVDSSGTFCFAFAPIRIPLSIIGNFQQQGMRVSYDLANSLVGFSTNQC